MKRGILIIILLVAGIGMINLTAPLMPEQLWGITAVSANISFFTGNRYLADHNADDIDLMDEASINVAAGLMTDQELAEDFIMSDQGNEGEKQQGKELERPKNAGKVVRKTLSAGKSTSFIPIGDSYVKNTTTLTRQEIQSIAKQSLPFTLKDTTEPQVLIYHTHATESYQPYNTDWFDKSYNARSSDNSKNMVAVGDILEEKLKQAGIGVIHNTEHFDKSYNGAYDRSRVMVEDMLKKYPSIQVVLDIHRDAIGSDPITAPVTKIADETVAQIMIIACKGTSSQSIPNHKKNLTFAAALQNQIQQDYQGLARPLLFGNRFYNQDLSVGSLLIEVGGHGNTLEEAKLAMSYTANSLIKLLEQHTE